VIDTKKISLLALFSLFLGLVVGAFITAQLQKASSVQPVLGSDEKQPLYWVAPMDANYRRDKPGKSPMGMDLIPVYGGQQNTSPGTVQISPEVVNNLGVRTVAAERKTLHTTIKTVGYVQYDEDKLVHMHPRVEGWVDKLYVKAAGDPVKKGQPIYELYSPQLVNAQEEFLLARNRNNLKLLSSAEQHLRALQISPKFIDALKKTGQVKQTVTFSAPQAGFVGSLNIREGFYVIPGTTLMSIATLDDVWVEAEIFERQASLVKVGQAVSMTLGYLPGEQWLGAVDYVYPTLNEQNRTARVRLRFANPRQLLKPNMFAQVLIQGESRDEAIVVPNEAVIRTGSQNRVVLALGEGRFKSIAVSLGYIHEEYTEILEGLDEGDEVVSSAQFLLDSESSKSSDFKRMEQRELKPQSVWVEAHIDELMVAMGMIKLTHQAIPEWDWPVMTMMFPVDDGIEMDVLEQGLTLQVELTQTGDTDWLLTAVHIPDGGVKPNSGQREGRKAATEHSTMSHSLGPDSPDAKGN